VSSAAEDRARKAAARFFLRVGQARDPWRDANTLPLFPLLLVMNAEMLDADAKFEAMKTPE
jgi:hypothetical protein